ncbi:DUF5994 family protein [Actinophytocola sp.]|uniref:DUF5994 family protein n=1 Tax=Actinophytocola sp. TaxID=1872138 RepID=UPI002ED66B44
MSSGPCDRTYASKATTAEQSLRVKLKPTAPTTRDAGYVDGAWWPRSRDPAAELPALSEALAARLGVINRLACDRPGKRIPEPRTSADSRITGGST